MGCYSVPEDYILVISEDSILLNNKEIYNLKTGKITGLPKEGKLSSDRHHVTFTYNKKNVLGAVNWSRVGVVNLRDLSYKYVLSDTLTQTDTTYTSYQLMDPFLLRNQELLVTRIKVTYRWSDKGVKSRNYGLFLDDLKTDSLTRLNDKNGKTFDAAAISPDGTKILYLQTENGKDVFYLYDLTTHSKNELKGTYYQSIFTPDDNNLLYVKDDKLWMMSVYGQTVSQLSRDNERVNGYSVSDNGQFITYSAYSDTAGQEVILMNLKKKQRQTVISWNGSPAADSTITEYHQPLFLPSGNKLIYMYYGSVTTSCQ